MKKPTRTMYHAKFNCRICGNEIELTSIRPITDEIDPACELLLRKGDTNGIARQKEIASEGLRRRREMGMA